MTELAARLAPPVLDAAESADGTLVEAPVTGLARRLYDAYHYCEWDGIERLLHPYGRFVPLVAPDDTVLGRDDLLAFVASSHGTAAGLGDIQLTALAADAVLCVGLPRWRYPSPVDGARAAIVTVKDGLLYRERAFASAPEAYREYLRHGLALGI